VDDGRKAFVDAFTRLFAQLPQRHSRIVRSVTQGEFVVLHVHVTKTQEDRGMSVVDIFRVADGRIVEHWDVQQAVPETSASGNTMF
jgi:predicted SnoaL-like aldol condensation-catalyzing enzyme